MYIYLQCLVIQLAHTINDSNLLIFRKCVSHLWYSICPLVAWCPLPRPPQWPKATRGPVRGPAPVQAPVQAAFLAAVGAVACGPLRERAMRRGRSAETQQQGIPAIRGIFITWRSLLEELHQWEQVMEVPPIELTAVKTWRWASANVYEWMLYEKCIYTLQYCTNEK
jgi:hypothetical protein